MYGIIGLVSVLVLVLGIAVGFFAFPMLIKWMIMRQVNLIPGTSTRQLWEKSPLPIDFAVYVFNLTNPEATQNGGKPKLQEVGPFVFEQWNDKYNLVDYEDEDAVAFDMRATYKYLPLKGLSGEELITMPHPAMQTLAISMRRRMQDSFNEAAPAIPIIFPQTTPFITAPFMDIFFRGLTVDCTNLAENTYVATICDMFRSDPKGDFLTTDIGLLKFSLLSRENHTSMGRLKVARGHTRKGDVGKVLQFNGISMLDIWPSTGHCNHLKGTDSTIFSPYLDPKHDLWTFRPELCRSIGLKYERRTTYAQISTARYTFSFGDYKTEPELQCFCESSPNGCPPRGTYNLSRCGEKPMIVSLPHFLHGDPSLLAAVEGLKPQQHRHATFMDIELISGNPLFVAQRMQFNLDVEPVPEVVTMRNLRKLVMPLFWVERTLSLGEPFTDAIKSGILRFFKFNNAFKWICIALGGCGSLLSGYMLITKRRDGGHKQSSNVVAPGSRQRLGSAATIPEENENNHNDYI